MKEDEGRDEMERGRVLEQERVRGQGRAGEGI